MLKVLIADDDPDMRLVIKKVLEEMDDIQVEGEADNGIDLIKMSKKLLPNIIFLDIDMPEKSGIDAAREIFHANPHVSFVFVTAYSSYALEAFELYAVDYLVKPFSLNRIKQTIEKITKSKSLNTNKNILNNKPRKLFIQSNGLYRVINIKDIIFITRISRRTIIYTIHGPVSCYEALQDIDAQLEKSNFLRSHQGYIINTDRIIEISPCGNKVYSVKFDSIDETALMTLEKLRIFKEMHSS